MDDRDFEFELRNRPVKIEIIDVTTHTIHTTSEFYALGDLMGLLEKLTEWHDILKVIKNVERNVYQIWMRE